MMKLKSVLCGAVIGSCALCMPPLWGQHSSVCDVKDGLQRADVLLKKQHIEEARAELERLRGCSGLSPRETFAIGWYFGRTHEFRQALNLFQSVAPDIPDRATHQYAVALTLFELQDYQGAVKILAMHGVLSARSVNLLAVAYAKIGRYQQAYDCLTEEIHRVSSDRLAYLNLITLLCDTGETKDALKIADQAVATFPKDSELLIVRGATYSLRGEADNAQRDFAAAIKMSPSDPSPRFLMAVGYYKRGDYQTAIAELSQAIQSGIHNSDLYYLMAECLLRINGRDEGNALFQLNRAIELNPRSASALALRGKLLLQAHRINNAVQDLELAHRIDPMSRSAAYNLARAYFALGKKVEAAKLMKQLTGPPENSVDELSTKRAKEAIAGGGGPSQ